ncbi:MarR family transcriptional regulator [Desulfoluna sp.]|uniref:MarR family winged helix-turn-helix transcriptional regulator n=1 Tax=Desulfoluna sp. TaxID=2045199 RepID=UPI002601DDC0|nr:MarR family transcriptional regulator [Desulfoluna sp.]
MINSYEDCICFLFAKANQKAQATLKKTLKPYGITAVQILILEALWEDEGLTAGEIGKRLVLDNATTSGVLDRLSEAGWISKETARDDKRALKITLSNKAKEYQGDLFQIRENVNDIVLQSFSQEERLLLKRLLKDLR